MRPHDEDLTPDEIAELGALLVAERPRPSEPFAAELDARVAARFERPARSHAWLGVLRRPFLPAAAATLAVGLLAVVLALDAGRESPLRTEAPDSAVSTPASGGGGGREPALQDDDEAGSVRQGGELAGDRAAPESQVLDGGGRAFRRLAPQAANSAGGLSPARKVERSASLELGAPADRVQDVAQDVLGTVARFEGIVDRSSVADGPDGAGAQFALRIPAGRLQDALAALSRLPDAHVIARSDEAVDVNQAYVSIRRRLANARAERAGIVNALKVADTEDEILDLQYRLDVVERTIAQTERAQRGLDRRIDYSVVTVSVRTDEDAGDDDGTLTIGRAFDDAGRVLEVAAAVVVIAAAALVPLAVLLAFAWPLTRGLQRRRREQALDAAA
jgi:hypothetical protein